MDATERTDQRNWRRTARHLLDVSAEAGDVADRMYAIARALLTRPYLVDPLGGGPDQPEQLHVLLHSYDCVTFVESVLALARARNSDQFVDELRGLRYRRGQVTWVSRLHYFSDWMNAQQRRGVLVQRTRGPGAKRIATRLAMIPALPERSAQLWVVPRPQLLQAAPRIAHGSVLAFASTRARLDYFHVGLGFWQRAEGGKQRLVLYHAARSAGGVIAEPLLRFLHRNRSRGVSFATPLEPEGTGL